MASTNWIGEAQRAIVGDTTNAFQAFIPVLAANAFPALMHVGSNASLPPTGPVYFFGGVMLHVVGPDNDGTVLLFPCRVGPVCCFLGLTG